MKYSRKFRRNRGGGWFGSDNEDPNNPSMVNNVENKASEALNTVKDKTKNAWNSVTNMFSSNPAPAPMPAPPAYGGRKRRTRRNKSKNRRR
jgi:hypothetical protein